MARLRVNDSRMQINLDINRLIGNHIGITGLSMKKNDRETSLFLQFLKFTPIKIAKLRQ
jgi:hypothetical protein